MTDPTTDLPPRRAGLPPRLGLTLGAAALLAAGITAGTVAGHAMRPAVEMAPLTPVAIRSLKPDGGIVTLRGRVVEVFGNKLVIDDGGARALVDTGPEGEDRPLAAIGAPVTVQGRFDRGFLHASFLVDPTGKVTALGPQGGRPPHDRHGPPPPRPGGDGLPPGDGPPAPQARPAPAPAA